MTSIYNISAYNFAGNNQYRQKSKLSEETIRKLIALGIDIESVSSESEAKKLIEQAEKKQEKEIKKTNLSHEEQLFERLKNLARKLNIVVTDNQTIEEVFNKIRDKIEELEKNSNNSNINVIKAEFEIIEQEYKNVSKSGISLFSAMNIMSQNNRAALGI